MRKYLAMIKAEWFEAIQNYGETILYIVGEAIPVFIMCSLWLANKNNLMSLNITSGQLVTYYFIILLVSRIIDFYFDEKLQVEIKDGTFSRHLLKPFSFPFYLISCNLGGKLFNLFLPSIPIVVFLLIFFKSQVLIPSNINMFFFAISLVIAYFINFAIS
jgi:ABC-type uncharacterized transport system permease subunit